MTTWKQLFGWMLLGLMFLLNSEIGDSSTPRRQAQRLCTFQRAAVPVGPFSDITVLLVHPKPFRCYLITSSSMGHPEAIIILNDQGKVVAKKTLSTLLENDPLKDPMPIDAALDLEGNLYFAFWTEGKGEPIYHGVVVSRDGVHNRERSRQFQDLLRLVSKELAPYHLESFRLHSDGRTISFGAVHMDFSIGESRFSIARAFLPPDVHRTLIEVRKDLGLKCDYKQIQTYIMANDGKLWTASIVFASPQDGLLSALNNSEIKLQILGEKSVIPLNEKYSFNCFLNRDGQGVIPCLGSCPLEVFVCDKGKFYFGLFLEERLRPREERLKPEMHGGIKRYYVNGFAICSIDASSQQGMLVTQLEVAVDVFSSGETEVFSPLWTIDRQGNVYYLQRGQEEGTTEIWMVPAAPLSTGEKSVPVSTANGTVRD